MLQAGETPAKLGNGEHAAATAAKAERLNPKAMWHEAAKFGLKRFDRPARISEIADAVAETGYRAGLKRRLLYNAIFVALKRRKDLFEILPDSRWKLKDR